MKIAQYVPNPGITFAVHKAHSNTKDLTDNVLSVLLCVSQAFKIYFYAW